MKNYEWRPINDFPGDQQADDLGIPGGPYWAQIGPNGEDEWSSTILQVTDHGNEEIEQNLHVTEGDAKAYVEAWRPEYEPRHRAEGREGNGGTGSDAGKDRDTG